MKRSIIKIVLILIAVLYIIGIICVPFMEPLRFNVFAWIIFAVYLLCAIFICGLLGNKNKQYGATDEEKKEGKISQELLKERNKWFMGQGIINEAKENFEV